MKIRLTHIDGKLPNLALMKLSHWHRSMGDETHLFHHANRIPLDMEYDVVYGSSIFTFSKDLLNKFRDDFPAAIIGGTGTGETTTIEEIIGSEYEHYDYSIYPEYKFSIGFTSRGCRLNCKFCFVPQKEGRPKSTNSIYDVWRGKGHPKNIVLLDNDFFGQPHEQWISRIQELIEGDFKVSFNQGINIRLVNDESAYWLSKVLYYDDQFKTRRLYTAWDNLKDEKIFFDGVDKLEKEGIPPHHLMVYMLVGYDKEETWERIFHRFDKMIERGIRPYPMVYNNENKSLREFQRWVVRRYYEFISWNEFTKKNFVIRDSKDLDGLFL
jgi:hypothetical protein